MTVKKTNRLQINSILNGHMHASLPEERISDFQSYQRLPGLQIPATTCSWCTSGDRLEDGKFRNWSAWINTLATPNSGSGEHIPSCRRAILCAKVLTLVWAAFGVVLGQIPT